LHPAVVAGVGAAVGSELGFADAMGVGGFGVGDGDAVGWDDVVAEGVVTLRAAGGLTDPHAAVSRAVIASTRNADAVFMLYCQR
jgi:hypothetical protein